MTCCVLSLNIGEEYTRIVGPLVETHQKYAEKWGYGYHLIDSWTLKDVNINFLKYDGMLKCFEKGYSWVLYVDSDAIINNHDIPLTYYAEDCPAEKDIIMMREIPLGRHCGLFGVVNGGVYIVRNTPWSRDFLKQMIHIGTTCPDKKLTDQDILNSVLEQNKFLYSKFHIHEWNRKYSINGFLSFRAKTAHSDDFIIHFISCVGNIPELIPKYMKLLKEGSTKEPELKFNWSKYGDHWEDVIDREPIPTPWPNYSFAHKHAEDRVCGEASNRST